MINRLSINLVCFLLFATGPFCWGQVEKTPFDFLRDRERELRTAPGEVYLGKVMTLYYPVARVEAPEKYLPLLLELTDLLKSPVRENYRIVIEVFSGIDSNDVSHDLWPGRALALQRLLVEDFYMKKERIIVEDEILTAGQASSETESAGSPGGRVEIHLHGDVTEAVRYIDQQEESR